MKANRILLIILGVLTVIGGMWCVTTPGLTYLSMVWVIGFAMFFHAIDEIVTYGKRKEMGLANGWNLAGAIMAVICGLLIIFSAKAEIITGITLLYVLFFWIIFAGVSSIFAAFGLKSHGNTGIEEIDSITGKWWIGLLFGILLIIAGAIGFAHPLLAAISIGLIVGFNIIVTGINMIAGGIAMS